PRYGQLFDLPINDYKRWARGLKSAGYATDPAYPRKLISIIERYELHQYDEEVVALLESKGDKQHIVRQNTISAEIKMGEENESKKIEHSVYIVKKGDTLYGISKRFGISIDDLKRQNNLSSDSLSIGQELIIEKS